MADPTNQLHELATLYGVQLYYWDVTGKQVWAGNDGLVRALRALGAPLERTRRRRGRPGPPPPRAVGASPGAGRRLLGRPPPRADLPLPGRRPRPAAPVPPRPRSGADLLVDPEAGRPAGGRRHRTRQSALPRPPNVSDRALPVRLPHPDRRGRRPDESMHPDRLADAAGRAAARRPRQDLGAVPAAVRPARRARAGGPAPTATSKTSSPGCRARAAAWSATLPMLAAFLDEPFEPSPYSPASRLFWNEFYLERRAHPRVPRLAGDPGRRRSTPGSRPT